MNDLPKDARHQVMRSASEMKIAAPPHPSGEERELVGCKSETGVTVFATLCHADADLANAAMFLDQVAPRDPHAPLAEILVNSHKSRSAKCPST